MTENMMVWGLIIGLVGLIWVIALAILLASNHRTHADRQGQGIDSPGHQQAYPQNTPSSQRSNNPA